MTRGEEERESARVLLEVLDVLQAALSGATADLAVPVAREMVDTIPIEEVPRVAAALAVLAVWQLPPAVKAPRTAGEIRERQRQLRRWVDRMRLEAQWVVS